MKTLLATTALAACFSLSAAAQTAPESPFQSGMMANTVTASALIGARIYASEAALDTDAYDGMQQGWSDIGEVNDVILTRDGTVSSVLVDIGGFLGMGERQVSVDMTALRFVQDSATDADDWFLVMQADRAMLENAPAWGTDAEPAMTSGDANAEIPGVKETMADETAAADAVANPRDGYAMVEPAALTSEMLTGAWVYDDAGTAIAEVSDLTLSADGQVEGVIMDVGGFLGMGERRVSLTMEQIEILRQDGGDEVRVYVTMTKEQLETLPQVES